jgi:hypothetical protein
MASLKKQVISFVTGFAFEESPELRGFDNRVIRRKARGEVGGPWFCADRWVVAEGEELYPTNGCAHSKLEHDDYGCMWTKCSCEQRGRR